MRLLIKIILSLLILAIFNSCSDKDKSEIKGISVFQDIAPLKVDEKLTNVAITIPTALQNDSWFGQNSDNNPAVENFSFPSRITKIRSVWSGFWPKENSVVFAPAIAKDVIYLLDNKGNLSARNLADKKLIWKKKIIKGKDSKNFTSGKISYKDEKIYASTGYDLVVAIDARNGEIIWSKNIGAITISTPIADQTQLFITTNDNKTYALNSATGEINWVHSGILRNTGILGAANPVFYKNYVIVAYSSGEIYTINKKTGEVGWSYDLNVSKAINSDFILNDIDSTPLVKDDVVYTIGNGGLMMSISIKDGATLWQKELASITDIWIAGDFIYLVNNNNQLICLYRKSGGIKWIKDLKKFQNEKKPNTKIIYNGIIMAGGNLILSNSDDEIVIINPLNGNILQTKNIGQKIYHTPIIVKNKLYLQTIGSFTSKLVVAE